MRGCFRQNVETEPHISFSATGWVDRGSAVVLRQTLLKSCCRLCGLIFGWSFICGTLISGTYTCVETCCWIFDPFIRIYACAWSSKIVVFSFSAVTCSIFYVCDLIRLIYGQHVCSGRLSHHAILVEIDLCQAHLRQWGHLWNSLDLALLRFPICRSTHNSNSWRRLRVFLVLAKTVVAIWSNTLCCNLNLKLWEFVIIYPAMYGR